MDRLLMRQLKIDVLSALVVTDKLMFVVVGARDFSPEITVLPIGTEVPCSDRVPPQIPICRADRGFFQNGADSSIAYKIYGTRVPMP